MVMQSSPKLDQTLSSPPSSPPSNTNSTALLDTSTITTTDKSAITTTEIEEPNVTLINMTNSLYSPSSSSPTSTYGSLIASIPVPAKRGHKYHVASACINCKKAHLACDVNRPCKRCITLGKTDTCLDIKHKKRGRPKLRHKMDEEESMNNIQVMSGTIQSPIITSTSTTINNNNNNHDHQLIPNNISSSRKISFCHQPIETFKKKSKETNNTTHSIITPIQLISTSLNNNNTPVHNNIYNKGNDNDTVDHDHFDNDNDLPIEKKTPTPKITLILSMEVCFARMTEDVTMAWGYYPQELAHRTMYDFIAMEDTDRLSRLHRLILDSIVDVMSNVDNPKQQQQMKKKTNHSSSSSSSYYRAPPPPTERSTSELFHQKSIQELSNIANGSVSFNDTLHIKTRSGLHELYDICMYIGGGLGGDLNIPSTFTKLYIVMVCHKHKKMEKQWPLLKLSQQKQKSNPSSSSSPFKPIAPFPSSSSIRPPLIKPAPHDLRQVILPAHFTNNSKLNTISVNDYSIVSPKINIAPISNNNKNLSHNKKLLDQNNMTSLSSPSSSSSSSFLLSKTTTITSSPTISLSSSSSTSTSTSVSSSSLITCKPILTQPSSSPTSTIPTINHSNFRFKSSSSTPSSSQPSYHRDTSSTVVNHPTTQYFLQTSSSNLNVAAASAVKDNQYGINNNPMNPNEVSSSSNNKKKGMSIRSLLC